MYFKGVNRGLNFTLLGRYLVVMTLGVGGVAISTGANGMYLFLGISLGLFTVSGLLSEKNIKYIKFHLNSSSYFFEAGRDNHLPYKIENISPVITLYSQHIEVFLQDRSSKLFSRKRPLVGYDFIFQLNPLETLKRNIPINNLVRGAYKSLYIEQNTKFPFGIFEKFKVEALGSKIFVLPPIHQGLQKQWDAILQKLHGINQGYEDFSHHQNYHPTVPIKFLNWKKNAGKPTSQWVTKTFESATGLEAVLLKLSYPSVSHLTEEMLEATLSNLRTGLESLHRSGFVCYLDLGPLGAASGYWDIKILLAQAKLEASYPQELRIQESRRVVYVNDHRAWVSDE